MSIKEWFKSLKFKKTKSVMALTLAATIGATSGVPVYAQTSGSGVSGGFLGAQSGNVVNGIGSYMPLELVSFHSGDWNMATAGQGAKSPAWEAFSQEISIDWNGVQRGDVDGSFAKLSQGGLDRQACEVSSSIWVVRDTTYPGAKVNLHRSWIVGGELNGDPARISAMLIGAKKFNGNGPNSNNLLAVANAVANHPSIISQDFSDLKVLCSYSFAGSVEPEPPAEFDTCVGADCENEPVPVEPPAKMNNLCTTDQWQSPVYPEANIIWRKQSTAGVADFNHWLHSELESSDWGAVLSTWGFTAVVQIDGKGQPVDQSIAWRCNQRFMTYYQAAPATYHTEISLNEVASPIDNNIYNNVFKATTSNSPGYESNSQLAKTWFQGMHIAGYVDDADQAGLLKITESPKTITEYGKVWNTLQPEPSNGSFDAFYRLGDRVTQVVEQDKQGGNFSSGTDLTLAQTALLGNGGIVNVQEKERTKIIRIVQPYYEIELSKCTAWGDWRNLQPSCNPIPSYSAPLGDESVDTTITDPNLLTLDQAQYVINRTKNLLLESNSVSSKISGFQNVLKIVDGNGRQRLQQCIDGVEDRTNEALNVNITNSTNKWTIITNISNAFNAIRTNVKNVTLPCQDVLVSLNPDNMNRILGFIIDLGDDFAVFANPNTQSMRFSRAYVSPKNDLVIQRAQFDPETVSWWQAISVNCNLSGFEQLVGATNSTVLSNEVSGLASTYHNVAQSPIMKVDWSKPETMFRSSNLFYGRPGTPSYYSSFFDKECPFGCVSSNNTLFGASNENDAVNNTPDGETAGRENVGYGAQVRDVGNVTSDGSVANAEISNTSFINIFRDNIIHRVRVDVWYPTNGVGQAASQFEEISNLINGGNILGFLTDIPKFVNTAEMMGNIGGSFGIFYDGSAPSSTTITRFEKGTPEIGEFFKVKAVTSPTEIGSDGKPKLDASTGTTVEIFKKGTNTAIPSQKANSHDVSNTGSEKAAILPNLVNEIDVNASWAAEKSRPQVFNFKWEYQVPSTFFSIGSAGFQREGTKDENVKGTNRLSMMFTILEGKCYAMFGTEIGKNTFNLFNSTTGSGVPNTLDNGNGVLSGSASNEYEENLSINTLRAVGE